MGEQSTKEYEKTALTLPASVLEQLDGHSVATPNVFGSFSPGAAGAALGRSDLPCELKGARRLEAQIRVVVLEEVPST